MSKNDASGGAVLFFGDGIVLDAYFDSNTVRCDSTNKKEMGGAVYFTDTGSVASSNFVENTQSGTTLDGEGGALYFKKKGVVELSSFWSNSAKKNGGAIYCGAGYDLEVTSSAFLWNGAVTTSSSYAQTSGGAIYSSNFDFISVQTSTFQSNADVLFSGSAIWGQINDHSTMNLTSCFFSENAGKPGSPYCSAVHWVHSGSNHRRRGTTYDHQMNMRVTRSSFFSNMGKSIQGGNGGGLYGYNEKFDNPVTIAIDSCVFSSNLATLDSMTGNNGPSNYALPGAIFACGPSSVHNSSFLHNQGKSEVACCNYQRFTAGAIYFEMNPSTVHGSTFKSNTAGGAGALYFTCKSENGKTCDLDYSTNSSVIESCTFFSNSASSLYTGISSRDEYVGSGNGGGGALFLRGFGGTVLSCDFSHNCATKTDGGAVYFHDTDDANSRRRVASSGRRRSYATYNATARSDGWVTRSSFSNNRAHENGGALFAPTHVLLSTFTLNEASYDVTEGRRRQSHSRRRQSMGDYGGGGMYSTSDIGITVKSCVFTSNTVHNQFANTDGVRAQSVVLRIKSFYSYSPKSSCAGFLSASREAVRFFSSHHWPKILHS